MKLRILLVLISFFHLSGIFSQSVQASSGLLRVNKLLLNLAKYPLLSTPKGNQTSMGLNSLFSTLKEPPPVLTITENATKRISSLLDLNPEKNGIIIGVLKRGCNGNSYTLNYIDDKPPAGSELVVTSLGDKVYVEGRALFKIIGSEMDFAETPLSSSFVFNNPNESGKCGCGESFNVKS